MPKSTAPRTQYRPYDPPSSGQPKAVCVFLVRPDGRTLLIRQPEDNVLTDIGGRLQPGESIDAAAARLLEKEGDLDLARIGARRVGSGYQRWSKAQVLVYAIPAYTRDDCGVDRVWIDASSLVRVGKARETADGDALTFRTDANLKVAAPFIALARLFGACGELPGAPAPAPARE